MSIINKKGSRRIESILDLKTGNEIFASELFNLPIDEIFHMRYENEILIKKSAPRYVCYFCRQPIKIRGQKESKRILHFAHLKDSDKCPIKTDANYTKEEICCIKYNGAKESELHKNLKNFIAQQLSDNMNRNGGVESVDIEQMIRSIAIPKVWKRPDVSTVYNNMNLVFELQLSTTFLSEIASRQEFYCFNKTFIIWIFNEFETNDDKRKFTCSDIYYSNNYNGFELDRNAMEKSIAGRDLILKCHYQKPTIKNSRITSEWHSEYINLSELTFDQNSRKVYYYDYEGEKNKLEIEQKIKNESIIISLVNYGTIEQIYEYFIINNSPSSLEITSLSRLYNDLVKPKLSFNRDTIEYRLVLTILLYKVGESQMIAELIKERELLKTLIDILSLKENKLIGYRFEKQVQIAHRLLDKRPQHLELYLKAVKHFRPNLLREQDRSNSLKKKIDNLRHANVSQTYNVVLVKKVFPELG